MSIDTLQVYDDLKACGIPEEQAHAQARAIANANRITPEDLAESNESLKNQLKTEMKDLKSDINVKFLKIENDLFWMRLIGGAMTIAFVSHWFK